ARPLRGAAAARGAVPDLDALIAEAGLGGEVAIVVADAATGRIFEQHHGSRPMPPASTLKIVTSLYALEHLGAAHRFETRLIATGPVSGGRLAGDLILAGGGDPVLDTDDLGDMVGALVKAGLRRISGRFLVWGGALPYIEAIDTSQPEWSGYNPAVCGLNLNFNRVNFVWKRNGGDYDIVMDARARRFAPAVSWARMAVADRDLPVYAYRRSTTAEEWSVARAALGRGGSRWLPVRRPDLYAGDVMRTLAAAQGITLPAPTALAEAPGQGALLVRHQSEALPAILSGMMKYSNNMTAEVVGMTASARRGGTSHAVSGREMASWLRGRAGCASARFADHSGLAGASRISPADMVRVLADPAFRAALTPLLAPARLSDGLKTAGARVIAKTGTLNFVSGLAGYLGRPGGREMAFAILAGDVARRDAIPPSERERPAGGRGWNARAKTLQQALLERWLALYGA
ncbi:D-alanyl-D-alanine carboxypeptidase/D-alanyl-D-alanine endopeptidase, partial [Albidovulum sp.]